MFAVIISHRGMHIITKTFDTLDECDDYIRSVQNGLMYGTSVDVFTRVRSESV